MGLNFVSPELVKNIAYVDQNINKFGQEIVPLKPTQKQGLSPGFLGPSGVIGGVC